MEKPLRLRFGFDLASDCGYMSKTNRARLTAGYEQVGKNAFRYDDVLVAIGTSLTSAAFFFLLSAFCLLASTCRDDSKAPYPSSLRPRTLSHFPRACPSPSA